MFLQCNPSRPWGMSACFMFCCTIAVLLMLSIDGESCSKENLTDSNDGCCYGFHKIGNMCTECPVGYYGLNCSKPCPSQMYGPGCTKKCHCHSVFGCDAGKERKTDEPTKQTIFVPDEVGYPMSYFYLRIIIISCGTFISLVLLLLMVREIRKYILLYV